MSRADTGKTPISVLAWRYSFFIVTPFYAFILWVFYNGLGTSGFFGKVFALVLWWVACNIGAFAVSVGGGIIAMRLVYDWQFGNLPEYHGWLQNGGSPFWDVLPWPINPDPQRVRMAITAPPDYDVCPYDGWALGRRFGNQCRFCRRFHDKGFQD